MERRKFIHTTAWGIAALNKIGIHNSFGVRNSVTPNNGFFVGTPVLPEYLFEQGIAETLGEMQEWAVVQPALSFFLTFRYVSLPCCCPLVFDGQLVCIS